MSWNICIFFLTLNGFSFSSGGCAVEVGDTHANCQGYQRCSFPSVTYFVNCEGTYYSITRIIFNDYICLNDINKNITKVNRPDEKPKY